MVVVVVVGGVERRWCLVGGGVGEGGEGRGEEDVVELGEAEISSAGCKLLVAAAAAGNSAGCLCSAECGRLRDGALGALGSVISTDVGGMGEG